MSVLALCLLVGTAGRAAAAPTGKTMAETIYTQARIWTGVVGAPRAAALAVRDGRLLAVGSAAEVLRRRGPRTRVVDLGGKLVVPGLIDAHTHFLSGGFQLASVDLRDASTPSELCRRIAAFAGRLPSGRWVTGGNWDHERWGGELPRRDWIDAQTPATPVFVSRLDGHMALANGAALRLARVARQTPRSGGRHDRPRCAQRRAHRHPQGRRHGPRCAVRARPVGRGAR